MVDVDVFRTPTSLPTPERLLSLQADLDTWVRRYRPDAIAIERVFADVNVSSVMGTAQASAVAMLAAASRGIPVTCIPDGDQGRRDRQWTRRQGPGHRDGHPPAAARRTPKRPTPTRWRWPSATYGAGAPRPGSTRPSPPRRAPGDRVRPRDHPQAGLDSVVVEVGGVGMLVHTTPRTAAGMRSGQTASLATSLVVREESLTLYGFADEDERSVFETVQTVSGFGPRLALAMLAVHRPDAVRAAR